VIVPVGAVYLREYELVMVHLDQPRLFGCGQ
jgi:hypothetical protein